MTVKNVIFPPPIAILFLLLIVSCGHKKELRQTISYGTPQHSCVRALTDIIIRDIFTAPAASRIYAYCNLAYYEAIRFKDSSAPSITRSMHGFDTITAPDQQKNYDFSLAAVRAFLRVAQALTFSKDSVRAIEIKLLQAFEKNMEEALYLHSLNFGDSVAAVILRRSGADNYRQTRGMPRYSVFQETRKWQQTPPDYSDAVEPHWKMITGMLMDSAAQFTPAPAPVYSLDTTSQYYQELMEVYTVSKNLTALQDTIAQYWDDNAFVTKHEGHLVYANKKTTPGGHWMGITSILCTENGMNEVATAEAYALAAAAIFDGFISCWNEKYNSRMPRPISVIQEHLDAEWESLLQTPPFPEYTSGHSVITAAAATVLTTLFNDNMAFTDTTELEYLGMKRAFGSIQAAADEAGISRLYGGIHYRSAIEQGRVQGKKIGNLYISRYKKATPEQRQPSY